MRSAIRHVAHWWPGVKSASYGSSPKPYGVGTFREATVGGQRYEEYMVAWDAGRRFAYYIDRATVPIAKAQLECTELADDGEGTRVRWTIACEPRLLLRVASPFFRGIMERMLARALANLEIFVRVEGAIPTARMGSAPRTPGCDGGGTARNESLRMTPDARRRLVALSMRCNPLVTAVLRSPAHWLLSPGLMLLTVTGRKSGRHYTIPVGYHRLDDCIVVARRGSPLEAVVAQLPHARRSRAPSARQDSCTERQKRSLPRSAEFKRLAEATFRRARMVPAIFGLELRQTYGPDRRPARAARRAGRES
jgi:hypothetical protein